MKIKTMILEVILSFFNFFVLLFPIQKDKITFVSLEGFELKDDLKLIYDELEGEYKCTKVLYHFKKNNLYNSLGYMLNTLRQLWHINRSTIVLINDNNFVISRFKRPGVKVIQVWHANGAIKKFGNCLNREYEIRNYDYILANSEYWKKPYAEAFGVSEEQVLITGLPKLDLLYEQQLQDSNKEKILKKYPQCKGKKIVLYAPTFRGNIYQGFRQIINPWEKVLKQLGDDYIILYKLHPLVKDSIIGMPINTINVSNEQLYELFTTCDILVSDYSSIVFDFMVLNKKTIYYVPDLYEYLDEIGCFMDHNELLGKVCMSEKELAAAILDDTVNNNDLLKKYQKFNDGKNLKRVKELIIGIVESKQV